MFVFNFSHCDRCLVFFIVVFICIVQMSNDGMPSIVSLVKLCFPINWILFLSSCYAVLGQLTRIVRSLLLCGSLKSTKLGSRTPYLLSHLTGPLRFFLNCYVFRIPLCILVDFLFLRCFTVFCPVCTVFSSFITIF